MNFYIGAGLQNRRAASWYAQRLKGQGWKQTYDWTKISSETAVTPERLAEIARRERQGVLDADAAIFLLPGGRGTHVELGMALALGKKVFLCAAGEAEFSPENTVAFYHLPGVVRLAGTDGENLEKILECAGLLTPPAEDKYPCPCCGERTFPVPKEEAVAYICPVCLWENDVFTPGEDEPSDENHGMTLGEGRANYRKYGAVAPELAKRVKEQDGNE